MWVVGEEFLNHSNIKAVPNKRQPGDSPRTTKQASIYRIDTEWADELWWPRKSTTTKADKKMGPIRKLNNDLPTYVTENVYTSYIRPQLEYAAVLYHNCTKDQANMLETCQKTGLEIFSHPYKAKVADTL